jgi:hypothetical protein
MKSYEETDMERYVRDTGRLRATCGTLVFFLPMAIMLGIVVLAGYFLIN